MTDCYRKKDRECFATPKNRGTINAVIKSAIACLSTTTKNVADFEVVSQKTFGPPPGTFCDIHNGMHPADHVLSSHDIVDVLASDVFSYATKTKPGKSPPAPIFSNILEMLERVLYSTTLKLSLLLTPWLVRSFYFMGTAVSYYLLSDYDLSLHVYVENKAQAKAGS